MSGLLRIIIFINIRYVLGLDRPVSAASTILFIGLSSRLFFNLDYKTVLFLSPFLLFILVTRRNQLDMCLRKSDVWLPVHRNSVWIRKTN